MNAEPAPSLLLAGKPAVQAALYAGRRTIHRLLLADTLPRKRRAPFEEAAEALRLPVVFLLPDELAKATGVENHGGVAAEVAPLVLASGNEVAARLAELRHAPLVFALEGFHDPHNLGYALRCVEALGVDAVLLSPRDWGAEEGILAQSSSGAYDRLLIGSLAAPRDLFRRLEEIGIESIAATAGAMRSFYEFDLRAPALIVVGGEFRGISDALRKACRHSAHLPMSDTIPSFPAGHAAAILAAEAARQRRLGGPSGPLWRRRKGGGIV